MTSAFSLQENILKLSELHSFKSEERQYLPHYLSDKLSMEGNKGSLEITLLSMFGDVTISKSSLRSTGSEFTFKFTLMTQIQF